MDINNNNSDKKRLAHNTIILYLRMMVIMVINLYISRAALNLLGVQDYGVYNVVGGFVTMFSLLSGSLSNAISRYITFELGQGNVEKLKKVFSTSVTVQIFLSVGIGLLLEIIGVWFLNYKMQIPQDRLYAANWTLQCSIVTFILNLISIPYNGTIIAHEKMTAFAYISIFEVVLKLIAVLFLFVDFADKLITYSILLMLGAVVIRLTYGMYCKAKFVECKYKFFVDKSLVKEMTALASWNFLGSGGAVLNNNGVNILINLFFGVSLNAARGIAVQVNNVVQQFAGNFTTAINPQITKAYSREDYDEMRQLVFMGIRYSYYLMLFVALPIIIETPEILKLWLKIVPEYTVVFVRLTLLLSLTAVLSNILFTVAMATGKIKNYQLIVGSLSLSIFFMTFLVYKLGADVTATYYISLLVDIVILLVRVYIVNGLVSLDIKNFLRQVLLKIMIVTILSAIVPFTLYLLLDKTIWSFLIIIITSFVATFTVVYTCGISSVERLKLREVLANKIKFL